MQEVLGLIPYLYSPLSYTVALCPFLHSLSPCPLCMPGTVYQNQPEMVALQPPQEVLASQPPVWLQSHHSAMFAAASLEKTLSCLGVQCEWLHSTPSDSDQMSILRCEQAGSAERSLEVGFVR